MSINNSANNEIYNIPFAKGLALQGYDSAEDGMLKAVRSGFTHWYIDGSLECEYPGKWSETRIVSLKNKIDVHSVKPIFHGNYKLPLSSDVVEIRNEAINWLCVKSILPRTLLRQ